MPQCANITRILIMTGFSKCSRYTVFLICQNMPRQSSKYILGSKYVTILKLLGSDWANVTQGFKYATIWVNMSE